MAAAIDRVVTDPQLRSDVGPGGIGAGGSLRASPGPGRFRLCPRGRLRRVTGPAMRVTFVVPRYGTPGHRGRRDGGPSARRAPGGRKGVAGGGADQLCRGLRHLGRRPTRGGRGGQRCVGPALRLGGGPGSVVPSLLGVPPRRTGPGALRRGSSAGSTCRGRSYPPWWRRRPTTDADVVVFYPTSTTRRSGPSSAVSVPTILHPAAHDEPALQLPVFAGVFDAADGLVFQTTAERRLVQGMFAVASHRQLLVGLGVDDPDATVGPGRGTGSGRDRSHRPYLLCLGRVDRHKGTSLLADLFVAYKARHPGPLRLVFAGPVVEAPADHPEIDVLGPVSDGDKWACSPGPWPWCRRHRGRPSRWWWPRHGAPAPRYWSTPAAPPPSSTAAGPGGDWRSPGSVSSRAWSNCWQRRRLRTALGERGRAYVDRWFRWPRVIDRYAAFIETVAVNR